MESKTIPKETNPPFVLKSSKVSPLNSGGGMGDQQQGGAFLHFSELPTSISSCLHSPEGDQNRKSRKIKCKPVIARNSRKGEIIDCTNKNLYISRNSMISLTTNKKIFTSLYQSSVTNLKECCCNSDICFVFETYREYCYDFLWLLNMNIFIVH